MRHWIAGLLSARQRTFVGGCPYTGATLQSSHPALDKLDRRRTQLAAPILAPLAFGIAHPDRLRQIAAAADARGNAAADYPTRSRTLEGRSVQTDVAVQTRYM